jgi:histidyl-tRNA synthetase
LELIDILEREQVFGDNSKAAQVFSEFKVLASYVKQSGAYENIEFDLSLARGLDYYTGLIFEITVSGFEVGSLGGGNFKENIILAF